MTQVKVATREDLAAVRPHAPCALAMKFTLATFILLSTTTSGFTRTSSILGRSVSRLHAPSSSLALSHSSYSTASAGRRSLQSLPLPALHRMQCPAQPTTRFQSISKANAPLSLRGGCAMSTSTVEEEVVEAAAAAPTEIFRSDYEPLPYKVSNVSMNFDIQPGKTYVTSTLTIVPNEGDGDLVLDGEADALKLLSIELDGKELAEGAGGYTLDGDVLTIPASLLGEESKLVTKVEVVPETNTQLSGLYKSGSMYCTQVRSTPGTSPARHVAAIDVSLLPRL